MWSWAQQTLANVAGTQEPIYGPDAIQSVTKQAEETPYTELKKEDLRWNVLNQTCVETQTFYLTTDDGKVGYAQVIYSNVMGLTVTTQFCAKVFYRDGKTPNLWTTDALSNHHFDAPHYSFSADNVSLEMSDDGNSYHITSTVHPACAVDITITRTAPGFKAGRDGNSYYGTDPAHPWGKMFHYFWPSCRVEGTYKTEAGTLDMKGKAMYIHALQGMKPHHAAARWNFVNFKGPTYSACMMEFTTPPSYGSTVVNVGSITDDSAGTIVIAGSPMEAEHIASKHDAENEWLEPTETKYTWTGKTADGKEVRAELGGELGERLDKVDVMAEVPKFVKQIVAGAAGTKPYIYQFGPKMTLRLKIGDEEKEEEGVLFTEATFIS